MSRNHLSRIKFFSETKQKKIHEITKLQTAKVYQNSSSNYIVNCVQKIPCGN